RLGETGGEREDLGREAGDVARGTDGGEGDGDAGRSVRIRLETNFGSRGADSLAQPGHGLGPARLGGEHGTGVAFEEREVRAVAADGDLEREQPAAPGDASAR